MKSFSTAKIAIVLSLTSVLFGCSGNDNHQDLVNFMDEVRARPKGEVEPLPTFSPYQSFNYGAMTMRSPFERPVKIVQRRSQSGQAGVKPDVNREKEFLETFNLSELKMVGTINQGGVLWALIDDSSGAVHRVKDGNFLGRNHGKIVLTTNTLMELEEIVSDGMSGWLKRPRTINIDEKE
jgi:type IV pilus assembly protein PilP